MKHCFRVFFLVISFLSSVANAQKGAVQYYESTPAGLEKYMSELKNEDPTVYAKLKNDAYDLTGRARTASWLTWGGYTISLVGVLVALNNPIREEFTYNNGVKSYTERTNWSLMIGSQVLAIGCFGAGFWIAPKMSEFYDFLNKHNRLRPSSPLKWGVVYNRSMNSPELGFRLALN